MNTINPEVILENDNVQTLGKLSWLWMNSPLHHSWEVSYLKRFVLPAIERGQYLIIERDGFPVAYCSWAFFSSRAELLYILDATNIHTNNWNSGERLWFIDWVAPFSRLDSINMKNALIDKFPDSLARAVRFKKNRDRSRVMKFKGRNMSSDKEKLLDDQFKKDFIEGVRHLKELSDRLKSPGTS